MHLRRHLLFRFHTPRTQRSSAEKLDILLPWEQHARGSDSMAPDQAHTDSVALVAHATRQDSVKRATLKRWSWKSLPKAETKSSKWVPHLTSKQEMMALDKVITYT